jgi:hypothetical protein
MPGRPNETSISNAVNVEQALQTLTAFDSHRSYCVEENHWAAVPLLVGQPHVRTTNYSIRIQPGVKGELNSFIGGTNLTDAVVNALTAMKLSEKAA